MYRYELVLSREAAGRLLVLAEEGRPAFLSASRVQGHKKQRLIVWEVAPSPPTGDRQGHQGWMEIPSPREFITSFDVLKVFSDRGIRVIIARRSRLERDYTARFARMLETYGRNDPVPQLDVGVIGLGRLGSKVVQDLTEQGVRSFVLVDPQMTEAANQQLAVYNRFPIGVPKVEAIKEWLKPYGQEVITIPKPIWELNDREWKTFADLDLCFLCVDNSLTRLVVCQHAMRAGIPVFEGGVHVDGNRPRLLGRIQTAIPGRWCLFCLQEASDPEAAGQELREVERSRRLRSSPRPADPTLSALVGAWMVLIFRQALRGGGIAAPRYTFQLTAGDALARRETPRIAPQCRCCRPSPAQDNGFWIQESAVEEETVSSLSAAVQRLRQWVGRLAERLTWFFERSTTWTGATVGGLLGIAVALGIVIGILIAIGYMIGFEGRYNYGFSRHRYGFDPWHFIWDFGSGRYDHHVGHYFGLIFSVPLMLSLPYLLFGLPILGMKWTYQTISRPFARWQARKALRRAFQGLEELRERWPLVPQLRVNPVVQRLLRWGAHGVGAITEVAAFALFLPILRAFGGIFWLVSLAYGLPVLIGVGIFYGFRYNHEYISTYIERLCQDRARLRRRR